MFEIGELDLEYLDRLINQNVWKAFATIHAGIHEQMRVILLYRFQKTKKGVAFGVGNPEKRKFLNDNDRGFFELANYLFVTEIIEEDFRDEILKFNKSRNKKLGHINVYKTEISDEDVKELCLDGIAIMGKLDEIIQDIFFGKAIIKH